MIFREIHISGFGIFNDFSLTLLKNGVNIITGNNEAGKSTLLKFIRYTLFGYPKATEQRMYPLNGGEHKGRITAVMSDKKNVTFERSAGGSGGSINMLYDGRLSEDQVLWNQLMGNATMEIFRNVYAFSLDELTDLDKLSASGVEDKIFSVSLGLGNILISDVEGSIQKRIDDIYTQKGKKQIIPLILKEINESKDLIRKIQDNLPRYQELNLYIKQLENGINDIKEQLKKDQANSDRLQNYQRCYKSFINIVNCDSELAELPDIRNYPADGIQQLRDLEKEKEDLDGKIQDLKNGYSEEKGIYELEEEIKAVSFNSELLGRVEKVEYMKANLEKYSLAVADMKDDDGKIEDRNKSIRQELDKVGAKWTEQNVNEFSGIISYRDRINDFKKKFDEIRQSKREFETQQKTLQIKGSGINVNSATIILSLICGIVSIAMFISSYYIFGIVFLLIAVILFTGRKYLVKETSFEKMGQQLSKIKDKEREVENNYKSYLSGMNLKNDLTPESVLEILRLIRELKIKISERDELKRKQTEQRIPFIKEFEAEALALSTILSSDNSADNTELLVKQIINEFEHASEQSESKVKLQSDLIRKQKELKRAESEITTTDTKLKLLLKSINAVDSKDFRKKYEEEDKAGRLTEERKNAVANIETVFGLGRSDEVVEFLKANNIEDIEKQKKEMDENISTKKEELNNKITELGARKNEMRLIEGESELAEIMTGLESGRQKLTDNYINWMAGKVALKLLDDVKDKYEREKQPEVIKNSINYFSKITSGRYKKISVIPGEKDVSVFDLREALKKIHQLSRGTREQLLISLRMGFIEEYEKRAEPLPVIVDEVLVNFDPERAVRTADVLYEFGKNRQIIIFTCHPETIEYFKGMDVNHISIDEVNF